MLRNDLAPMIPLDGMWGFALAGGQEGTIAVPGCWEAQGYPKDVDGPARYWRSVDLPDNWAGGRVLLEFDAVSYACTISVNGVEVGQHLGMWTPFAVDVSAQVRAGAANLIELEVVKPGGRYPMRSSLAGFLPDVATTFGGIWQPCRLRHVPVALDDLLIDADPAMGQVRVRCSVDAAAPLHDATLMVEVLCGPNQVAATHVVAVVGIDIDITILIADPQLWSPDRPTLYTVEVRIAAGGSVVAAASERVGFRTLAAVGEQVHLNGQPIMLRGVLSWGWDPELIAPCFSDDAIRQELRRVRELGFNLVKLCLVVPNHRYYALADEEGMLLWQEWPMWLPSVTPALRAQAPEEYAALMRLTRHHPSVVLYSVGCELNASVDAELLGRLDGIVRGLSSGVLVCDNSGSGEAYGGLPFDFADFADYHTYADIHHLEPLLDNWLRGWQPPRPWIFGETCDADAFRDLGELAAANGGAPPWWTTEEIPVRTWRPEVRALIEQEQRLAGAEPGFSAQQLVAIGTAQALMVRKFWLEALRRRPATGGYVITGLRDTPIATSGIFDDLGRSRGTPADYRAFNGDAVLCLDVGRRRRWLPEGERVEPLDRHCCWAGTPMRWHIILSHAAPAPVRGSVRWRIVDRDGREVAGGSSQSPRPIPPGVPREAGVIDWTPSPLGKAAQLRLEVSLEGDGIEAANSWPVWVFPPIPRWPAGLALFDPSSTLEALELPPSVGRLRDVAGGVRPALLVTNLLAADVLAFLRGGGRVLLLQCGDGPLPARRSSFWREALKLFPDHPLWQRFPVAGCADLQFFGLATDASIVAARIAEVLPDAAQIRPIMRRLDARYFDISEYLVELRVGAGRLLVCTLRLQGGVGGQPWGPRRHPAGQWMLAALLEELAAGG